MIKLDWTLLVQLAIFLSFVAYLNVALLQPMARYLTRRKETLEQQRTSGGSKDAELEKLQREYSEKVNAAREEMLARRTAARKETMSAQNSLLEAARKDAGRVLEAAEAELAAEIAAAKERLGRDSRSLAASISTKILGRACQ
jgi:F-type H+-transporting ATPase subunit b